MPTAVDDSKQQCAQQKTVLIFYDQANASVRVAKNVVKCSKSSRLLKNVVDACSTALRVASSHDQDHFYYSIEHTIELADSRSNDGAVLCTVLSCFAQLGCLALLWDQQPSLFKSSISSIGICTGVIASAASLFFSSDEDIPAISSQLMAVAYRMGIEADRRSKMISPRNESWSTAVKGFSKDEALDVLNHFNEANNLSDHRRAYISAILPRSVTISGPPETLDSLFQQQKDVFPARKMRKLPIYAAFHSGHLTCPNIERVLGDARLDNFQQRRRDASIMFPVTSEDSSSTSLRQLLHQLIGDCFQSTLAMQTSGSPLPKGTDPGSYYAISIGPHSPVRHVQEWLDNSDTMQNLLFVPEVSINKSQQTAIVGYAGRFPNADTLDEFWSIIESAKDVHQLLPENRFDRSLPQMGDFKRKSGSFVPNGCFMKQPGDFDNSFFNMSPREALQVDPIQRILLMVTQEALEMAGYSKETARTHRIGTFFGQATDDWRESHASQNIDIYYIGGGMRAFGPGRLNYHFKWEGPSYSIDAACSSSLAALELASRALHSGGCDIAVVGGGNLLSAFPMFSGLHRGGFTSPRGPCKTFDDGADGYCRGEGVGVVVVKRLEDTLQSSDNVKGIVEGISTNHSALAVSINHPHAPTQASLMRDTLNMAALEPQDIDYVEFHGTGTVAGDEAELSSVGQVFMKSADRRAPLYIGAVKANVGHGEAAAGILSLIKALLMIEHEKIPPHAGIKSKRNPALEEDRLSGIKVPDHALDFRAADVPRRILINNFNATGGNTSMILRSPQSKVKSVTEHRHSYYPVVVSAKNSTSLRRNLQNLKDYVDLHPKCSLADLSYTTTARRLHFRHREAFVVDSLQDLSTSIETALGEFFEQKRDANPSVAFVFSGQGNQSAAAAKSLYDECVDFRRNLEDFDELCLAMGFPSFLEFLLDSESERSWSPMQLQLAVVAVEMALVKVWESWGLRPSIVMGHSLGEYPALCVAGVLPVADMFRLVGERAKLMEEKLTPGSHAMLAVTCPPADIKKYLDDPEIREINVAAYNCLESVTLSGPIDNLEKMITKLDEASIRSKRLEVQYAFHSAMLDPILSDYQTIAESITFQKPKIPIASTYLDKIVDDEGVFGPEYLANQCRYPVDFLGAITAADSLNEVCETTTWIEIGPGNPVCLPLIQRLRPNQDAMRLIASINTKLDIWQGLLQGLADCYKSGAEIQWDVFHMLDEKVLKVVDLPSYAFDLKNFWIPLRSNKNQEESEKGIRLSPLLHHLEQRSNEENKMSATFSSQLSDPDLFEAIQGHEVLGAPLCPSSVYAAIALEAVSYLTKESKDSSNESSEYDVHEMDIQKPLIVRPSSNLRLYVSVTEDPDRKSFEVKFSSKSSKESVLHAVTMVKIAPPLDSHAESLQVGFLVRARMQTLENENSESRFVLQRKVIYKLFSSIVNYGSSYQGIKSMYLSNKDSEGAAEIAFPTAQQHVNAFDWHLMDCLIHTAGFILNNGIEDSTNAFISDGWSSLRLSKNIARKDIHKCYARLAPLNDDAQTFTGNVYAFSENGLVASCIGLRFRQMKMKSLQRIISQQSSTGDSTREEEKDKTSQRESKPTTMKQETNRAPPQSSDVSKKLRTIICEEAGISYEEIHDTSSLQDLGLDSILIAEVGQRIQDEFGIELSTTSIIDAESVEKLEKMIGGPTGSKHQSNESNSGRARKFQGAENHEQDVQRQTVPENQNVPENKSAPENTNHETKNEADILIRIIARETEMDAKQVEEAADLNELGVDSLLAVEILEMLMQETGRDWPQSFLKDHSNVNSIRAALVKNDSRSKEDAMDSHEPKVNGVKTLHEEEDEEDAEGEEHSQANGNAKKVNEIKYPECKSTLIQGSSKSGVAPLILLPPGMGAAAVYNNLLEHPSGLPIYGLSSPYLGDAKNPDFTIENAVTAYVQAIERICPSGIFHLGGWSLGGILAYEAAKRLIQRGRQIGALLVIDCPFPDPWPASSLTITTDALTVMGHDKIMMERHGTNPQRLKEHVAAIMNAFKCFSATPMGKSDGVALSYYIISTRGSQVKFMERALKAQQVLTELGGLSDKASQKLDRDYPELIDYENEEKESLGSDRWERLLGDDVVVKTVNADHISMITEASPVATLSKHIYEAVDLAMKRLNL